MDDTWKRNTINRWTSDQASTEYGIWSGIFTINTYTNNAGINGNYTDIYLGNFQVSATVARRPIRSPIRSASTCRPTPARRR